MAAKAIIDNHQKNQDGWKIFHDLVDHQTKSNKAALTIADLLYYLTTSKIDDNTWHGTTETYTPHWCKQLLQYNNQINYLYVFHP